MIWYRERGEKAEPWGPAGREARRAACAARAAAKRRVGEADAGEACRARGAANREGRADAEGGRPFTLSGVPAIDGYEG